jgi:hypothetical protein
VAWLSRTSPVLAALLVASVALSSCGTNAAVVDARRSCRSVHTALALYAQSQAPGITSARQSQLQSQALSALLKATAPAAAANSIDGGWNPLVTTINEAERVPMGHLVAALTRLCKIANSSTPSL